MDTTLGGDRNHLHRRSSPAKVPVLGSGPASTTRPGGWKEPGAESLRQPGNLTSGRPTSVPVSGSRSEQRKGMARNPVAYAESKLGVHDVFGEVQQALDAFDGARRNLASRTGELRALRDNLTDLEATIASEERGANPDMSAAAFDRHLKARLHVHADHQRARSAVAAAHDELDRAEALEKIAEKRVDVLVARLHELAGLLNFYAARTPPAG